MKMMLPVIRGNLDSSNNRAAH